MLKIGDGRGMERRACSEKNRENIVKFFTDNPGATKTECAKELGISTKTVDRHVQLVVNSGSEG